MQDQVHKKGDMIIFSDASQYEIVGTCKSGYLIAENTPENMKMTDVKFLRHDILKMFEDRRYVSSFRKG